MFFLIRWNFRSYGQLAVFLPDEFDEAGESNAAPKVKAKSRSGKKLEKLVDVTVFTEDELSERNNVQIVPEPNLDKHEADRTLCPDCGKMIALRSYDKHARSHKFKCNLCSESFSSEQQLEAHMDLHQDNTYPCVTCNISFKDPLEYALHDQKHSAFGIFKCPICPFETTKRTSLRAHIKVHNNDFRCICEICGRGFLSVAAHADHLKLHEGGKQFACEHCGKNFNLKRYLDIHKKLNHKDILFGSEEWFTCHVCSRKFKFQKSLARHLSCIHDIGESRRVPCPICAKIIANNYNLKVHMRLHNGERPYVCQVCQMAFSRSKYLKRHTMRKHKSYEPLVTITEIDKTKAHWNKKLPEIEIIPVGRDGTLMIKREAKGSARRRKQHPVEITKRANSTISAKGKKKASTGYVNPFNYENLTIKNFHRKNRHFDSANLKWACMICSDVAYDKQGLIEHYEVHKRERDERIKSEPVDDDSEYFNCAICGQEFTSLKGYEKHFDKKHGERKYSCIECSKVYKDALQLCIHNFTVHPLHDRKYKCISCDYTTLTRKKLKQHLEDHEASFQFKCEVCSKGFELETDYEEHKIVHGVSSPFSCDVCGKTFPYTKYLLVHKKTAHPEIFGSNPAANECQLCNKRFAHKKSLILHIRGHTGENAVLCDMCGKRLSSSEHLKQHLRIHTGFKPHKCSVCGKGFAKKCNLTLHERVHSGEKPYVCRVCSKAFSQRSTVVIHERYHSGERPYVCTLCNKGFVAKGLLSVHIKTCTVIPAEYL